MSSDVFELICAMNRNSVEMQLAVQCAPLIAGLKISNLLIIPQENEEAFENLMKDSDLSVYFLTRFNGKIVYLLFRYEELEALLCEHRIKGFFSREGYRDLSIHAILRKLKNRYEKHTISGGDFPHEMGLLLGYPIEDVEGFIENGGNNCLYTGYWKVYNKPEEKKQIFRSYEKATERIIRLMSNGMTVGDIINVRKEKLYAI